MRSNSAKQGLDERWLSFMKSVSTVKSLVDAGLQFDPTGYGTLAFSIVSFGFDAVINHSEIEDDVAESCNYISGIIDEYAMYEARYINNANYNISSKSREALEKSIIGVYTAVIAYVAEMKYYINHKLGMVLACFVL